MTDLPISSSGPEQNVGPFAARLEGWRNDDLLLADKSREQLEQLQPALFAVLDWPELRPLFIEHDRQSNHYRRQVQRIGTAAIILAVTGLGAGTVAKLVAERFEPLFTFASSALATVTAVMLIYLFVTAGTRSRWLVRRIWTERIRQLYYQLLLANLPLVGALYSAYQAAHPDDGRTMPAGAIERLADLKAQLAEQRAHALLHLKSRLEGDEAHAIDSAVNDLTESGTWLLPAWQNPPFALDGEAEIGPVLDLIAQRRIAQQLDYTGRKIREGFHSPITRHRWIKMVTTLFSVASIALGVAAGIALALSYVSATSDLFQTLLTCQAVAMAIVVLASIIDKGLAVAADAERYEWYEAAMTALKHSYEQAETTLEKVHVLRRVEETSYAEMRRFLKVHKNGAFPT